MVVRPGETPELEDRIVRDLPQLAAAGRCAGRQRHQGDSGAPVRAPDRPRRASRRSRRRCTSGSTARAGAPSSSRRNGSRPATSSASATRAGSAFSASSTPRSEHKGEGGEVTLAFAFHGRACSTRRSHERGDMPLPPYIAARRARRTSATAQTIRPCSRTTEGSVAAPTAGLHFTDDCWCGLSRRGHRASPGDAACRRRHLSAGQESTTPPTTRCTPNGAA